MGTGEGVILVYDLRTATKWRVFEARERAARPGTACFLHVNCWELTTFSVVLKGKPHFPRGSLGIL